MNGKNDIAIIIPAYKETKNIAILLKKIYKNIPNVLVVVVDDSPKQDYIKLRNVIKQYRKKVTLLTRKEKMGRGSAVLFGLKTALLESNIKYFFEMDADLAHSPDELHIFLDKKIEADLVIGSRYLKKSNIIKWPLRRIIMSRIINMFLHLWLGLDLSDYTNGFRLYSRKAVKFLVNENLRESGFIALSEVAYKLKRNNFRIMEVPISFTDRKYGKSNADIHELFSSFWGAIRLRFSMDKHL